jgi:hypothetical protein
VNASTPTVAAVAWARVSAGMRGRSFPLVLCALVLAGCGGDDEASTTTTTTTPPQPVVRYAREPTIACLERAGYEVSTRAKDVGFIAYTAVGGGLRAVKAGGGDTIMAFGVDGDDAAQTLKGIAQAESSNQGKLFRVHLRRSNVAILWAYLPTAKQKKAVYGCLKAAG